MAKKTDAPKEIRLDRPQTRFIPIPKWPNYHPWPSVAGLRWMVFNKKKNGFAQAFPKIGGRILVDEARFIEIARSKGAEGA